ncbi:NAD(P)-binding protein [Cadophora sp. DSE1049]|nr:NAD(P)-binding protein [Cadophora sp. DSE1049]
MDAALVTGCSEGGLGEGIVRAFVDEGVHVFATARSLSSLTYLQDLPNTTLLALDVTSPESIASAFETVKSHTNPNHNTNSNTNTNTNATPLRLKYLINNAGLGLVKPVLDGSGIVDVERAVFETNVWGPLALIRAFAPLLISAGNGGMIINITSGGALVPLVWNGVYAASKAAMFMLSETMRLELEPLGVRTATVVLGVVRTRFHANLKSKSKHDTIVVDANLGGDEAGKGMDGHGGEERFQLAEGSYYEGMRGVLRDEASGKVQDEKVMSAKEAGRRIVRDTVRGRKGRTYVGSMAGMLSIVGFLPVWLVDFICRKTGQLDNFVKAV